MSDENDILAFFEKLISSIDLSDNLNKIIQDEIKYGDISFSYKNQIGYNDPKLKLIYEVIES